MPELTLTEAQLERLETAREELEAAYVGPYGHVRRRDVVEYLLDTYTPPGELAGADAARQTASDENAVRKNATREDGRSGGPVETAAKTAEALDAESSEVNDGSSGDDSGSNTGVDESDDDTGAGTADPESTLQQAMSLLDAHDGKWREGSGDEPYEVDLPDGSVEPARTKDDVRRLLFKHHR